MRILLTCFFVIVWLFSGTFIAKGQGHAVKLPTGALDNYPLLVNLAILLSHRCQNCLKRDKMRMSGSG